jgi:hypothetical protein
MTQPAFALRKTGNAHVHICEGDPIILESGRLKAKGLKPETKAFQVPASRPVRRDGDHF